MIGVRKARYRDRETETDRDTHMQREKGVRKAKYRYKKTERERDTHACGERRVCLLTMRLLTFFHVTTGVVFCLSLCIRNISQCGLEKKMGNGITRGNTGRYVDTTRLFFCL